MKYGNNIEAVVNLNPDYLGFIFYEKSSRFFDSHIPTLPGSIKKVGVFVDANIDYVSELIENMTWMPYNYMEMNLLNIVPNFERMDWRLSRSSVYWTNLIFQSLRITRMFVIIFSLTPRETTWWKWVYLQLGYFKGIPF